MVNALGQDINQIWRRLLEGDQSGLTLKEGYLPSRPVRVGEVPGDLPILPQRLKQYNCRNNALALSVYLQIESSVQKIVQKYGPSRVGVVVGSSTSGVASTESAYAIWRQKGQLPPTFHYVQHELGGLAKFLADLAGLEGPAYTLSTACSSSAKVFASARALIRDGWCDAVLVGGADSLCRLTVQGFLSLEALSEKPCNSMSRNREGFNLGEGAALFIMEKGEGEINLLGVGESSDAYQMAAPDPAGLGALVSMFSALKDADLKPDNISYLNLHGTGTILNDRMESLAISKLFSDVPASSSKGMVGHTLGASGAMGVGFCWLALTRSKDGCINLPPHVWDECRDENIAISNFVAKGQTVNRRGDIYFLSNSFGFGGSNCSVIIGGSL